ncbi:MAG: hypothetical protein COY40_04875 [Alphaproteobacteria bacterium CG_4_10_14_0_8_um_filter_53_9]|nr:MAG: hypothetical protein COY40_04875 [Alphaproteobacteria bacterium CG_4_10_14_0_8_um_filter_53_9]
MIEKVGLSGLKGADKTKKARKSGDPNAPKFADMIDHGDGPAAVSGGYDEGSFSSAYSPITDEPREPATPMALMDALEGLAAGMLNGQAHHKIDELERLVDALPSPSDQHSPEQKQALNELATRAAVTLAQLKK